MKLEKLVAEAQRGDDEAFYQLIYLHKDKLYKVAYAFLRNEADSLEAIQEATCRAYLKLSQLRQPEYISTWLTRIVIHVCMDEQKRKKRWILDSSHLDHRERKEPLMSDQAATRLHLEDALARLAPLHRHVIILKYFEDLTIREIAAVLGHPEGTIKTWLHKALGALRNDLGKEW
ncbi:sigma-70 family RNA polymerase sigma factor [Brevibacillus choshinensis]|uniref:Sigma-70 family RNA polymerase sigma factor n=1 Tax=Brevibacillus choshinensis TaxID=54911 RepID=A0ABX7FV96_BRECH|nr:sigma-70 family RNA polymerase sigma factor [Brevibacillus choshinensis]QRG69638.1 sigma-70 family RNA polymerase sigma factor [Brevibacillus choshinensis]